MAAQSFIEWTDTLVYPPAADGHLDCLHLWAIGNSAALNIFAYDLFEHQFQFSSELLGHMVTLCLIFSRTTKLFSMVATPFYIPTSNVQDSNFSTSLPTVVTFPF